MKILIISIFFFFFNFSIIFSQEVECQGAILRILNKTTNEKSFVTVPLSRTIELHNSILIVHRCLKIEGKRKNDEVALLTHKLIGANDKQKNFFGWIFKSSQYINSPNNPVYDIKLNECLIEDPIFLKKN